MLWFGKKKQQIATQKKLEKELVIELRLDSKATDKAIAQSKKITKDFNDLINKNGFTLKIHSAAGGKR